METRHAVGMVQQLINRHAVLQPYLKNILVLEGCEHVISPNAFRFYADGCPGIIFQQSAQGIALNHDPYPTTSVFQYGQTLKPVHLTTSGRFRILVFILYPYAIRPLLGIRADELTETCFDLSRLPTISGFSLLEQLLRTDSVTEQAETIASCLLRMLRLNDPKADPLLNFAVSQIQATHGTVSLRELQKTLNITERTFERRFEQYIGISPRLFSRICRFQSTLEQLKNRKYEKPLGSGLRQRLCRSVSFYPNVPGIHRFFSASTASPPRPVCRKPFVGVLTRYGFIPVFSISVFPHKTASKSHPSANYNRFSGHHSNRFVQDLPDTTSWLAARNVKVLNRSNAFLIREIKLYRNR